MGRQTEYSSPTTEQKPSPEVHGLSRPARNPLENRQSSRRKSTASPMASQQSPAHSAREAITPSASPNDKGILQRKADSTPSRKSKGSERFSSSNGATASPGPSPASNNSSTRGPERIPESSRRKSAPSSGTPPLPNR